MSNINIADFIKNRHSCRRFDHSKEITDDQINSILEAGRWAPSATNFQPWQFVVVKDKKTIEEVGDLFNEGGPFTKYIKYSPLLIGIITDNKRSRAYLLDGMCAVMNMTYEAEHQGLRCCMASCVFFGSGQFRHKVKEEYYYNVTTVRRYEFLGKVKEILNIPKKKELMIVLSVGYKDEAHPFMEMSFKRKPLEDIVHYEKYSKVDTDE